MRPGGGGGGVIMKRHNVVNTGGTRKWRLFKGKLLRVTLCTNVTLDASYQTRTM